MASNYINPDNALINKACIARPVATRNMLRFTIATIRERFHLLPLTVADIDKRKAESPQLWGFKRDAYLYITANYRTLHRDANAALARKDDVALMFVFLRVPGLGLAKAGFACQLFSGRIGCIDTHNARVFDVPANMLRFPKTLSVATQVIKVQAYVDLCLRLGGSGALWDAWCDLIAVRQHKHYVDGDAVSHAHITLAIEVQDV